MFKNPIPRFFHSYQMPELYCCKLHNNCLAAYSQKSNTFEIPQGFLISPSRLLTIREVLPFLTGRSF